MIIDIVFITGMLKKALARLVKVELRISNDVEFHLGMSIEQWRGRDTLK